MATTTTTTQGLPALVGVEAENVHTHITFGRASQMQRPLLIDAASTQVATPLYKWFTIY